MSFCSTRDSSLSFSLDQAVLSGIAPDGGLFFPRSIPTVSKEERATFSQKSFVDIAETVFSAFAGDTLSSEEIHALMRNTYSQKHFANEHIAPVRRFSDNLFLLELFHGPTGAFKDFALQFLPRLMSLFIAKTDQKHRCVLVATSGDTGGAALAGFANVSDTSCVVFFPKGGVSPLQQAQMQSASAANVRTVEIGGDFDMAQGNLKAIFTDANFSNTLLSQYNALLSSANSINIGRLLPQVFYAFAAYAQMVASGNVYEGEEIDICVPTGNFGDLFAAFLAKQMGLPLKTLICASNANSTSAECIRTGVFDVRGRSTKHTLSPAMDILKASNIERLLFHASGGNAEQVAQWENDLYEKGYFSLDTNTHAYTQKHFDAESVSDAETQEEICLFYKEHAYLPDPHTAVALRTVRRRSLPRKMLVFSTAHYGKFGETVFRALFPHKDIPSTETEVLEALEKACPNPALPQHFYDVLHAEKVQNTFCRSGKENMEVTISEFLSHRGDAKRR